MKVSKKTFDLILKKASLTAWASHVVFVTQVQSTSVHNAYQVCDCRPSAHRVCGSVAVLAEILLRSPQKIFMFIIKKIICWVKVSKNETIKFWKKLHVCAERMLLAQGGYNVAPSHYTNRTVS